MNAERTARRIGKLALYGLYLPVSILLAAATCSCCAADDTVIIKSGSDGQRTLSGTIVDFTSRTLTFRTTSGRESSIPATAVIDFKTTWSAEKSAADSSFAERDFAAALDKYRAALSSEKRDWASRLVQANIVWCLRSLGRPSEACNEFFRLLAIDSTRQYLAAIPLVWTTARPSAILERRARSWLEHEEAVVRLMGASWLLSIDRGRAVSTLEQLSSDSDTSVAQLAEAQRWRTKITTAADADITRWQAQVARIPLVLRGGPYLALGRVMAYRKMHERAAVTFMRIPTMYPKDSQMVVESLLAAAGELDKLDRTDESSSLYRELVNQYPETPQAGLASTRLKTITAENRND